MMTDDIAGSIPICGECSHWPAPYYIYTAVSIPAESRKHKKSPSLLSLKQGIKCIKKLENQI